MEAQALLADMVEAAACETTTALVVVSTYLMATCSGLTDTSDGWV